MISNVLDEIKIENNTFALNFNEFNIFQMLEAIIESKKYTNKKKRI